MSEWQTVDMVDLLDLLRRRRPRPLLVFRDAGLAQDREAQEWLGHVEAIIVDDICSRTDDGWPTRDAAASEEDG